MYRQEDVDRGVERLSEARPGWENNPNLDEGLDMWSPYHCVLGKTFGHYEAGLMFLGLSVEEAPSHGFAFYRGEMASGMSVLLKGTWEQAIWEKRSKVPRTVTEPEVAVPAVERERELVLV